MQEKWFLNVLLNHLVRTKVSKNIGFNILLKNALTVLIEVVSKYPLRVIYTYYGTWDAVGKEMGWKGNYKFFRTLFSLNRMTDFNVFCTESCKLVVFCAPRSSKPEFSN